eukprot:15470652-Alexandrium_andersonii.AAC.1
MGEFGFGFAAASAARQRWNLYMRGKGASKKGNGGKTEVMSAAGITEVRGQPNRFRLRPAPRSPCGLR